MSNLRLFFIIFLISAVHFFSLIESKSAQAEEPPPQSISKDLGHPKGSSYQDSPGEASFFQLEEELVSVASKSITTLREAPAVVTVLTREEIINSGAQDLMGVLRLIPGVQFGMDVQGSIGPGIRGLWGQEGKVLLIWDGHELNDLLYGTIQFGQHLPIDDIERIEMIRGPGSVLYGGFAELSVINIITRSAKTHDGNYVTGFSGQTANANSRLNMATGYSKIFPNKLGIKGSVAVGKGILSDRQYTDVFGSSYDMKDNSDLNTLMASFDINYKGLDVQFLFDRYHTRQRDQFDAILPSSQEENFDAYYLVAQYAWQPTPSLRITPRFEFQYQQPWNDKFPAPDDIIYNRDVVRYTGYLTAEYTPKPWLGVFTGTEVYFNEARDHADTPFSNGKSSVGYWDVALFGELDFKLPVNIRMGIRYDQHEQYGASIVPRIALTKAFKKLHFKLLFSQGYRAPSIENINLNQLGIDDGLGIGSIRPEKTTVFEVESGYKITDNLQVIFNFFDMRIQDPILYFVEGDPPVEVYRSLPRVGTEGFEFELRWTHRRGYLNFNYSYYAANHTDAFPYEVPGHSNSLLGFARHKVAAYASVRIIDELRVNPTFIFLGPRYGYASVDAEGNGIVQRFDPVFLVNLNVIYQPKKIKGLQIQAGVNNLFGENDTFIQPYNNLHAPLPSLGREYLMKVMYDF